MVTNSSVQESQSDPSLSGATLFTLICYCAQCVRQHTRRRQWCTPFQEGRPMRECQLARTFGVGGKSFMQVKV
jgi:hypothetical protein